ncbi:hypothetical protein, partial [Thiolapillus sp.]|uniref:hypothetical protein n=1 Tax=Thiolapillus sp. TaxID=2017437 RepID=UPI0025DDBB66
TPRSEAYFVFPLAQGTPGKQCGLAATGGYQPSLRSPWLAASVRTVLHILVSQGRKMYAIVVSSWSGVSESTIGFHRECRRSLRPFSC